MSNRAYIARTSCRQRHDVYILLSCFQGVFLEAIRGGSYPVPWKAMFRWASSRMRAAFGPCTLHVSHCVEVRVSSPLRRAAVSVGVADAGGRRPRRGRTAPRAPTRAGASAGRSPRTGREPR